MVVAEYVVNKLIEYGVTDTFGIPGGVILRLLDAMRNREPVLSPHLLYHEQAAGFAACGYAQSSGKLGVAYATRGPGILNMITSISEAYQESLPVLFITAHGNRSNGIMRFEYNQELNIVSMISGITKLAINVEAIEDVVYSVEAACQMALNGRRGPVLLDFSSKLWEKEISEEFQDIGKWYSINKDDNDADICERLFQQLQADLTISKRPVILIGDGIRHSLSRNELFSIVDSMKIPVLSSRGAQDLLSGSPYYFGYIGSHGIRYGNFILSKADLIISIGNRLAFPSKSESFSALTRNTKFFRIDIDEREFIRRMPRGKDYRIDVKKFWGQLRSKEIVISDEIMNDWYETCMVLKSELEKCDCSEPVNKLIDLLKLMECDATYVCDVGNNEFWFARAFERCGCLGTVLISKSFGTLGVSLCKAIGVYYAKRKPVICVTGDQGVQFNIQELQYIKQWNLPVKIVIVNNNTSGMILDHEKMVLGDRLIHVDELNGYTRPDFSKVAYGFGIEYTQDNIKFAECKNKPIILEIKVSSDIGLTPSLPKGKLCQDMVPMIDRDKYNYLNQL